MAIPPDFRSFRAIIQRTDRGDHGTRNRLLRRLREEAQRGRLRPRQSPGARPPPVLLRLPPRHRAAALAAAEELLRELESFAAADPQAVLARCDQLRFTFRDTPLEPRFRQIEAKAQERLKEKERSAELDRALASIRKIIADDPDCARRAEVEKLIEAALQKAGPRSAEVEKLQ